MDKTVYIAKEDEIHSHQIDSRKMLGLKVLSKSGTVLGKVSEIKMSPEGMKGLGILVRSGLGKKYFIGRSYLQKVTHDSIILGIDPTVLIEGKRVFTHDGMLMGKVSEVVRKGNTNDLKEIVIKSFFKKPLSIPASSIHMVNKSVILSRRYNGKQKYFWQRA